MKFDVLTLFPDMFEAVLGDSIIARARKAGIIETNFIQIRDFSKNKHKKTDDAPYSGGGGMLMTAQPIYDAYQSIVKDLDYKPHTIYMSPEGTVFNQQKAIELSKKEHIVILSGHYEGVDQRVLDMIIDEEISIGDFVLTGGEIPAMAVIDAVSRMLDGTLSGAENYQNESHYSGLLEYPQYTRPEEFMGVKIPEVLLSGNHKKIEEWKRQKAIEVTYQKRPDLLENIELNKKEKEFLDSLKERKE